MRGSCMQWETIHLDDEFALLPLSDGIIIITDFAGSGCLSKTTSLNREGGDELFMNDIKWHHLFVDAGKMTDPQLL